jgi:hypothetical protein
MRRKLSYSNVVSTVCLFLLLGGGAAYAAGHLGKNTVGSKQLQKNAVTTAKVKKEAITAGKVKKGTLTGTQINSSTLGVVPTANRAHSADTAGTLGPQEAWHVVGAAGEPVFEHGFRDYPPNPPGSYERLAFFKDAAGIVHLKGGAEDGEADKSVFRLPPGFRPASETLLTFPVSCGGCAGSGIDLADIFGSNTGVDGEVRSPGVSMFFDGITFRAES